VAAAIADGKFASGEEHFMKVGAGEGRLGGFSGWDEEGYLVDFGDVRLAIVEGRFRSGIQHYLLAGAREGRDIHLGLVSPQSPGIGRFVRIGSQPAAGDAGGAVGGALAAYDGHFGRPRTTSNQRDGMHGSYRAAEGGRAYSCPRRSC
jgi:hypothetical protein